MNRKRQRYNCNASIYKVVQIWPGQTVTCLHTNRPGHIWTTLYFNEVYIHDKLTSNVVKLKIPKTYTASSFTYRKAWKSACMLSITFEVPRLGVTYCLHLRLKCWCLCTTWNHLTDSSYLHSYYHEKLKYMYIELLYSHDLYSVGGFHLLSRPNVFKEKSCQSNTFAMYIFWDFYFWL
jgi:hypothetical protein